MLLPLHDSNPTRRTPWVTLAIIGLNTIVFLATLRASPTHQQVLAYRRGFVPARIGQLVNHRPIVVPIQQVKFDPFVGQVVNAQPLELPPVPRQILLSLLSCMFLHGGWMHLIGNMWFLWLFGNNVEDRLGPVLFPLFYLVGGLLASACHWLTDPSSTAPVIGASGAVAAMLGAYAVTWPTARVRTLVFLIVFITVIELPALLVLAVWFLGQLVEAQGAVGGIGGGVAWWAHVGGFMSGMAMMPLLSRLVATGPHEPPEESPDRRAVDNFFDGYH